MTTSLNTGTRDIPLKFAAELTTVVNHEWENGGFMARATPVTGDLLRFWLSDSFCDARSINFHAGQRQAILNTIYLHPKYCMKMATGTGKTWVLNALLIWQYINAKLGDISSVRFPKNFLIVAPGLIVYERLLDAYLGKEDERGVRNFDTSDFNIKVEDAVVIKKYFSEVDELKMRENFSLPVTKTIYELLPYPSNKGELEKNFILYCDSDSGVDSFLKINENQRHFAHMNYIRTDGMPASYYPDFMVKTGPDFYLVETKAQKDVNDPNVKQKELGTLDRLKKINELNAEDRMVCEWKYALLGETTFYAMRDRGASVKEILEFSKLTRERIIGTLF